jgi:HlyD family secretion protein
MTTEDDSDGSPAGLSRARPELIEAPSAATLPAVVPVPIKRPDRRWFRRSVALLLLILAASGIGYWWFHSPPLLPPGFAAGNGRLEANQLDIDTKFAGRIAKLFVDEGDMVSAGQVLAIMGTQDLQASLKKAQAVVNQAGQGLTEAKATQLQQQKQLKKEEALARLAQRALEEARANLGQQETQLTLAQQQFQRTSVIASRGYATLELLDQRRQQLNSAIATRSAADARVHESEHALEAANHDVQAASAAVDAAAAKVGEAQHALDAATHEVELYRVNIVDNALVAPRDGRIEYRVANAGEVLAAGGKVFTMLDTSDVYMDIYLPTAEAGRVRLGSDARILLDAYPAHAIPAKVAFIASQAQFTPKTVETKEERDKLMFRIRVRIDPERLRTRAEMVRSGLPGIAYVRTDPNATWPPQLQGNGA